MAVRTSPRRKQPTPAVAAVVVAVSGLVGDGGLEEGAETRTRGRGEGSNSRSAKYPEHPSDEDDDLPDLSTLLGSTSRKTGNLNAYATGPRQRGRGRNDDELRVGSPDKNEKGAIPPRISSSSTSRKGSNPEVWQSDECVPRSMIMPMPPPIPSSSSLFLGVTPFLLPSASRVPDATTITTTTTGSSRQTIQQRNSPSKRGTIPPSPTKISIIASLELEKKKKQGHADFISEISAALDAIPGSPPTASRNTSSGNNGRSRPPKLAHVNSLLLPLSSLALDSEDTNSNDGSEDEDLLQSKPSTSKSNPLPGKGLGLKSCDTKRTAKARSAMFVLKEADCRDDDEEDDFEEDDEFTDLSGFIVDDDADISFHGSGNDSGSQSESECLARKKGSPGKKKLVRGSNYERGGKEAGRDTSDALRSLSLEGDESKQWDTSPDRLADAIAGMYLGEGDRGQPELSRSERSEIEVIDLTSSPVKPQPAPVFHPENKIMPKRRRPLESFDQGKIPRQQQQGRFTSSASDSATNADEAILRFSPHTRKSPFKIEGKKQTIPPNQADIPAHRPAKPSSGSNILTTPPQNPPASPSKLPPQSPTKLNSPSKNSLLLSPSKRGLQIPRSPHRQSIDAFWSSEVINEWNDQYSPVKPASTLSPRKRWRIFEDDEDGSGSESPCESPARRKVESPVKGATAATGGPSKRMGSPSKRTLIEEKKATAAAKKKFDETKLGLAHDLLRELDERISNGKLAQLSRSTGGVKIIWSKNLRSTAGRANWRRTVTKASTGSPIKGDPGEIGDAKVLHYASIELAEKVIDNEERLVGTLAHEYCHLANFMVSGVRDQPHGASFGRW